MVEWTAMAWKLYEVVVMVEDPAARTSPEKYLRVLLDLPWKVLDSAQEFPWTFPGK